MKRIGIVCAIVVAVVAVVALVTWLAAPAPTNSLKARATAPPTTKTTLNVPNNTCGTFSPQTTGLQTYLNQSNTTITLPSNGCWHTSGITIQNTTNLTINANGAQIEQFYQPSPENPLLTLWNDKNLTINGLVINGNHPNASNENGYGVQLEGDNGVTIAGSTVENVEGDWVYLAPPNDIDNVTDALNTNITFNNDKFLNAGYHGFTFESVGCLTLTACNGATIENSTMTNMGVDAMDFEYDTYSTGFNTNGTPFWAAQDYVTIKNNTWTNWNGSDWLVSDQGQTPGVQFQHLTVTGNTLNDNAPFMEIVGTDQGLTATQYTNDFWTITNNKYSPGYITKPYRGGSSATSSIFSVSNLTMTGNVLPLTNDGSVSGSYALELYKITGSISTNSFTGAAGVVEPETYNNQLQGLMLNGNTT